MSHAGSTRSRCTVSPTTPGENTWTKAGTWLRNSADGMTGNTASYYIGASHRMCLSRDSDGYYHFTDGTESGHNRGLQPPDRQLEPVRHSV